MPDNCEGAKIIALEAKLMWVLWVPQCVVAQLEWRMTRFSFVISSNMHRTPEALYAGLAKGLEIRMETQKLVANANRP